MIRCINAVTIEEAREIREHQDVDRKEAADMRPRRPRKRPHTDDFVYCDLYTKVILIIGTQTEFCLMMTLK